MKAIQVKYLAPTNTLGTRLKVWAADCKPKIIGRDYAQNIDQQAFAEAEVYAKAMGWNVIQAGWGTLPNGDYVYTMGL